MRAYDDMTLGQRLKMMRKHARVSQDDIAERCGVSQGLVSFWERDRHVPSFPNVVEIAKLLGIPLERFADDADERPVEALDDELKARGIIADIGWREAYRRLINAPRESTGYTDVQRFDEPRRAKDAG